MKLFISIFLILSHLFSTVGFSMEVHECAGKRSYSFYGISLSHSCGCEHNSKQHGRDCCKDKKTIVKAEHQDKQSNKVIVSKYMIDAFSIHNPILFVVNGIKYDVRNSLSFGAKHPPVNSPPLYILYNVFLI